MKKIILLEIYCRLFDMYGLQGWWPLLDCEGCNPTKTGSVRGYHPGDYSYPKNEKQRFEIIIGTVLTQNTAWPNVEKAMVNMDAKGLIDPQKILDVDNGVLKDAIRPAGYFNQKSAYLKNVASFFLRLRGGVPSRDGLLSVKGIGNETADSILLYAYSQPEFVVDAYTKRILVNLGLINEKAGYMDIKNLFESSLEMDYKIYQEYHALIVEHAKNFYNKKDNYKNDPLLGLI